MTSKARRRKRRRPGKRQLPSDERRGPGPRSRPVVGTQLNGQPRNGVRSGVARSSTSTFSSGALDWRTRAGAGSSTLPRQVHLSLFSQSTGAWAGWVIRIVYALQGQVMTPKDFLREAAEAKARAEAVEVGPAVQPQAPAAAWSLSVLPRGERALLLLSAREAAQLAQTSAIEPTQPPAAAVAPAVQPAAAVATPAAQAPAPAVQPAAAVATPAAQAPAPAVATPAAQAPAPAVQPAAAVATPAAQAPAPAVQPAAAVATPAGQAPAPATAALSSPSIQRVTAGSPASRSLAAPLSPMSTSAGTEEEEDLLLVEVAAWRSLRQRLGARLSISAI